MNAENEFQYDEDSTVASEPSDAYEVFDQLVVFAVSYDLTEAENIKNFLHLEGFQAFITDAAGLEIDDLAAHIENGVDIKVFHVDEAEAIRQFEERFDEFLEEQLFVRTVGIDSGWGTCPECQSKNLEIIMDGGVGRDIWNFVTMSSPTRGLRCGECGFEWETAKE